MRKYPNEFMAYLITTAVTTVDMTVKGVKRKYVHLVRVTILFFLLLPITVLAIGQVKLVNLARESNKLKLTIESNRPISFEFEINEKSRSFSVGLQGADYYLALTDYFQVYDIDSLVNCLDDLTIIPVAEDAARFETKLGEGLSASVYDDTANSPGVFRVVIQFVARHPEKSPCFSGQGVAGQSTRQSIDDRAATAVTPVIEVPAPTPAIPIIAGKSYQGSGSNAAGQGPQVAAQADVERPVKPLAADVSVDVIPEKPTAPIVAGAALKPTPPTEANSTDIRGFLALDSLVYANKGGEKGDDWLDEQGDSEVREAMVDLRGNLNHWPFQLRVQSYQDLAEKQKTVVSRASLGYGLTDVVSLDAGILAEPFGGDAASSLDVLPFLEPSLTTLLAPGYSPGLRLAYVSPSWQMDMGVFGKRADWPNSDQSVTTRFAFVPWQQSAQSVRVDLALSRWQVTEKTLAFAAYPDAHLIRPLYTIVQPNSEAASTQGLAVSGALGSIAFTLDTVKVTTTKSTGASAVAKISANSAWLSFMLTNETRQRNGNEWLPMKPTNSVNKGGWGAWELGARYSVISHDSLNKLSTITVGLNWYINDYMQLKYNYVYAVQAATEVGKVNNDADLMELRLQLTYW